MTSGNTALELWAVRGDEKKVNVTVRTPGVSGRRTNQHDRYQLSVFAMQLISNAVPRAAHGAHVFLSFSSRAETKLSTSFSIDSKSETIPSRLSSARSQSPSP